VNRTARQSLWFATLSAVPFCIGATAFAPSSGGIEGPSLWPCPLRTLTGIPCPLCGATRSVVLAVHGDERFLDYNPWWVAILVAGVVAGLAGATLARNGRGLPPPPERMLVAVVTLVLVVGWLTAIVNVGAIDS